MPHQITINATPEKVYEAITTTEGIKNWWTTEAKVEPEVGSVAEFGFYNRKAVFLMHIDHLEQGKLVEWTAQHDMPGWKGTTIRFELKPNDNGDTILNFNHSGWDSMEGGYSMINTTWGSLMYILKNYVEGKNPEVWHQS